MQQPLLKPIIYRLSIYELSDVDELASWGTSSLIRGAYLCKRAADSYHSAADKSEGLEQVAKLNGQLVIIALWRCVELFRSRVANNLLGSAAAKKCWRDSDWRQILKHLNIEEANLVNSSVVSELRQVNNAIKHGGHVSRSLANANQYFMPYLGDEIPDLFAVYPYYRKGVEGYLENLVDKADEWINENSLL